MLDAIIVGNAPAEVLLDNPDRPTAALVWLHSDVVLFGGHPDAAFTRRAAAFIAKLRSQGRRAFMAIPTSTNWDNMQLIFKGYSLTPDTRLLMKLHAPRLHDWQMRQPADITLRPLDADLLCQVCYENMHYVTDDISATWPSQGAFLDEGFGYASLLHESVVAGWCTSEYLSPGKCAISIETMEEFQNQGVATLNAAAFVAEATRRGLDTYWDCWADFRVCRRLAEKVGFRTVTRYPVTIARL
jgi:GNAT superfamily N-acetyltransferase